MTHKHTRLRAAAALIGGTLLAAAGIQSASAQPAYDYYGRPIYQPAPDYGSRPLTVQRPYAPRGYARPAYNPYQGPAALITAPVAVASTIVALPFRLVNGVFPVDARDPRVIVGAPVYAAGQVAQLPFRAVQAPFGGWDYAPQ